MLIMGSFLEASIFELGLFLPCNEYVGSYIDTLDSPGFNLNYESAPFKLTAEYVDLLGGTQSPAFKLFEDMVVKGMFALKRNMDPLYAIVKVDPTILLLRSC